MTVRFNTPRAAAFDANGNPRSGAKLYFYEPTTLTPKDVYSDPGLSTPILQPVTASAAGLWATIFMQASTYRVICKDSDNQTIYDEDNFDPGLGAGFGVSSVVGVEQGGTGASTAAAARANLEAASSDALTEVQDTLTEHDDLIESGLHSDGDRFGLLAKQDTVTRTLLASGFGLICIQRVVHTTVVDSTITSSIPKDTTIPQITEGDQIFTKSFTPLSASSTVRIRAHVTGDGSVDDVVLALFKNSTAAALCADIFYHGFQGELFFEEASASTSARTYSLRAGVASGTFTVNGGTQDLGNKRESTLIIEEWVTV